MVYMKREAIVDTNWYVSCSQIYSCILIRKQAVLNSHQGIYMRHIFLFQTWKVEDADNNLNSDAVNN